MTEDRRTGIVQQQTTSFPTQFVCHPQVVLATGPGYLAWVWVGTEPKALVQVRNRHAT